MALIARLLIIAAFCSGAVYLASAAFVPSMGTGRWELLFGTFAGLGLLLGGVAAAKAWKRRGDARPKPEDRPPAA